MKSYKKYLSAAILSLVVCGSLFAGTPALAEPGDPLGLGYTASAGLSNQDIRVTVGRIISIFLSVLGTVAVVIILIAGFEWMTAGGNASQVETAQKRLTYAVIGLAIILSAYALTDFIVVNLYQSTTGGSYYAP